MKHLQVNIMERSRDTFYSWVVCLSSFFIQFLVCGIQNSFGTIFVALLSKFGKSESETVWVGATAIGLTFICGPLSTYLCDRLGCRIVACIGSVLLAVSGFLTSFASSIHWMYFTYGVLNGLASSMLYFSSLVALIKYFYQHLPTASGIAYSGSGVGTVTITILIQHLISRYGLKIAFQTLAGMSVICFIAGLAYAPLTSSKESTFKDSFRDLQPTSAEQTDTLYNKKSFLKRCLELFKLGKHWNNKGFVVWTIAMTFIMFACYVPLMYIVRVAEDVGVPPSKGAFLISIFAICSTVGKITFGKLANLKCANRLRMAQMALFFMAASTCLLPLAKSYSVLLAYSAVQGFFDGCFAVLIGLITNDIVGNELMAGAVASVYFVISIPMTIGPPVAGMFYDHLGSYSAVFYLSGILIFTGMFIMFLIPWLTPPNVQERLTSNKSKTTSRCEHGKLQDLSCIDEKNLESLFGESGANYLLRRNKSLLDASSQRSSFVLFTIVSDENQRDISAHSSYQNLAVNSCNTPSFSGSLRSFFHGSHSSLFSLNHSVSEVPHLECIPEMVANSQHDSEHHFKIQGETTLKIVEEVGEITNDNSTTEEHAKTNLRDDETVVFDDLSNSDDDIPDGSPLVGVAEEVVAISLSTSNLSPIFNCDSKEYYSKLSTGTVDSGFDECNFSSKDSSSYSCSCNDVYFLSEEKGMEDSLHKLKEGVLISQDLIDSCQYEEDYCEEIIQDPNSQDHDELDEEGRITIQENNDLIKETNL